MTVQPARPKDSEHSISKRRDSRPSRNALDSSVLIAAHISRAGVCAELLEELLLHHELVASEYILEEITRKLREKFNFPASDARLVTAFLRRVGIVVAPAELPPEICRDPTDLPVLETAVAGQCVLLISVDRDLLDMVSVQGIPIVRPGEFWDARLPSTRNAGAKQKPFAEKFIRYSS